MFELLSINNVLGIIIILLSTCCYGLYVIHVKLIDIYNLLRSQVPKLEIFEENVQDIAFNLRKVNYKKSNKDL